MVEDFLVADIHTLPPSAVVDTNSGLSQLHGIVVEAEALPETNQV
jgi:hypothetical protein